MKYTRVLSRALLIFTSALPLVLFCLCGGYALLIAFAIVLHELAHVGAIKACGGHIKSFHPAPFGLCIDYSAEELSLYGELFVCSAGCLANLCVAALALICYAAFSVDFLLFGMVNATAAMLNLIPIYPLDGSKVLYTVLLPVTTPHTAWRVMAAVSYTVGFLFFLVASYLFVTGACGVYPMLFSVYIFAGNAKILASE